MSDNNVRLRWFVTCSEHGLKTEPVLQYWNGYRWQHIEYVECKEDEREEYMTHIKRVQSLNTGGL